MHFLLLAYKGQLTRPTPAEQQLLSQETALVDLIVISRNFIYIKHNVYFCACSERGEAAKCFIYKNQKSLLSVVV